MLNRIVGSALMMGVTLGLTTVAATAGTVAGKVEVGSTPLVNAVVSIEGAPGTVMPQRAVLDQRNKSFEPHVLAVTRGSVIELLNDDDFLHNTFSRSGAKVFNLNQPNKGSRSLLKVDQAGVIDVRCHIHGQMQAWIVVVDTPYFAMTDSRGIFHISGVPAGTYKIHAWSERAGNITQEVKVTGGTTPTILKYAG